MTKQALMKQALETITAGKPKGGERMERLHRLCSTKGQAQAFRALGGSAE